MKRAVLIELAKHHAEQAQLFDERSKMGCRDCTYFRAPDRHCSRWFNAVPREHVDSGCDEFDLDMLPF